MYKPCYDLWYIKKYTILFFLHAVKIVFHLVNALCFENILKRAMFVYTHTNTLARIQGAQYSSGVSDNGSHFTGYNVCHSQVNK